MPLIPRRIGLLFAVFLVLLGLAAIRATWLGTVNGASLRNAAATQQAQEIHVPATRGAIVDRRGTELAVSEPADDVSATPYLVKDAPKAAKQIAGVLGLPEAEVLKKLLRRDTGFVYLARSVPARRSHELEKLKIAGLTFTPTSRRVYPRDYTASQVLGHVGVDGKGLSGLEYSMDHLLKGNDGTRKIVRDALGEAISVRDPDPAEPGSKLELTLDAAIQDKAEQVLQDVGAKYTPKGATAVVLNPQNGDLLALANWPRVDANDPGAAPDYAKQNRAVAFNYEPGSTFKAFTVAGALEDDKVTPDTMFNLPPKIQVADREIGESHERGYISLPTKDILAQSSNVGSIMIGQRLGATRFDQWVRKFGFGKRTGVDLPGEEAGQVLDVEDYSGSSMGNLPIGQGVSVTPMQMASAYMAIANGGVLRPTRIVKSVDGRETAMPKGHRVISERTASSVRTMLKGVLAPGGTASEAKVDGYELAGKTGTANKVDPETGEYSEANYIASFVGFAPADHPKLLVAVMVDEPKGAIYGGEVAAPAFQKITSFALTFLKIPPK
ncbi:MAG TPA: penicillin-binding protein 2 [Solirubrobacteraceae bacterium]|nr:penicillin-binding protein 2 [Solirubrobacteraceae bacterium]